MAQIFHASTNTIAKVTIYAAVLFLALCGWVCSAVNRSSYNTGETVVRAQPVQFSHEHHVNGLGLDCRFCHSTVETSAFAGMPPTETCYGCHKLIWADSPELLPVRESARTGVPIAWSRVYDLPDFVYFNHSIHLAKGVGCGSCHGDVAHMQLLHQAVSLQMEWCLSCHRDPGPSLRPGEALFDTAPRAPDPVGGAGLAAHYQVRDAFTLTNCSTCHR